MESFEKQQGFLNLCVQKNRLVNLFQLKVISPHPRDPSVGWTPEICIFKETIADSGTSGLAGSPN